MVAYDLLIDGETVELFSLDALVVTEGEAEDEALEVDYA